MKILLAEDDIRLGRAVKRVFEEEGYDVTIAVDGSRERFLWRRVKSTTS